VRASAAGPRTADRCQKGRAVPYVIAGNTDSDRIVYPERGLELAREFFFPLARGEELTPELLSKMPEPYFVNRPARGGIPEIFGENLGVWTVKENVREIVEELEPRVHTFIPVNLRVTGADGDWGRYFLLYPGQAIDVVVIDETDFAEGKGRAGFAKSSILSSFGDTVLNSELIAGRQLWRGARGQLGKSVPFSNYLFCSDALAMRIKDAGIEGWRFRRCRLKDGSSSLRSAPE
jgi:hypothetical protein